MSDEGAASLDGNPDARDFISDAYAHRKFVAYTEPATAVFEKIGLSEKLDDGFAIVRTRKSIAEFIDHCGQLRYWDRVL